MENRWRLAEVVGRARGMAWRRAVPWTGLCYAVAAGAVLAAATVLWGPRPGMIVASGAVNAGAVGTTVGLCRRRAAMCVSLAALAVAAFLGMVTAGVPALSIAVLALLGALAGLLARTGQAAATMGVQAMVGFVTLGRFPQPAGAAALLAAGIVAGGLVQLAPATLVRAAAVRAAARRRPSSGRRERDGYAPEARGADRGRRPVGDVLRETGRALTRPDPLARWHALRLAVGLALAQCAAVWPGAHRRGYWISLTVLNVLKPGWVSTASRGIDRWAGTLAGVLVVGSLAQAVPLRGGALVGAVALFLWGAYALQPVNYGLYCMCIAGYVVLFLQVVAASPADSALYRAVDTTLGGLLALLLHIWVRRPGSRPSGV